MVQLADSDILTREVLDWRGLHLLHWRTSTCSQKLRIILNLKGVAWTSHLIDLTKNENLSAHFLGINPRGLVPVLIDDGAVHIESNDILRLIEGRYPNPPLLPADLGQDIEAMLDFENDIHLDLRALSFRFLFMPAAPPKSEHDLQNYRERGSGTVEGVADHEKQHELDWWARFNREGISTPVAIEAARRFRNAFSDLDKTLSRSANLLSETVSALDIAWIVYVQRLTLIGYPVERMHPHLFAWFERHMQQDLIAKELVVPAERLAAIQAAQHAQRLEGKAFEDICASALV
jgi:glutathione S-transferase